MVNHQAQAQPTSAAGRAQQEASTVDRSVLPAADSPFRGRIEVAFKDSTADWPEPLKAPEGAPNVLLIMGDDIGYGHMSAFGGPANTPVFDRLAARGGSAKAGSTRLCRSTSPPTIPSTWERTGARPCRPPTSHRSDSPAH
jgi:hypothetical protein